MSMQIKLAISMIAVVASGWAVFSYLPGLTSGSWIAPVLSLIALLASIVCFIYIRFKMAYSADGNESEKNIVAQEKLKLKGKGIK